MNKIIKFIKSHLWVIPTILLVLSFMTTTAVSYYLTKQEGNNTTKFETDSSLNYAYVRATVVTYWEEVGTDNYVAKTPWSLKEGVTNNNWSQVDGYYYYEGKIEVDNIINGIPMESELINSATKIDDLTDDYVESAKYTAKYKILYEVISAENESPEIAWGVSVSETGEVSKIEN